MRGMLQKLKDGSLVEVYRDCGRLADKYDLPVKSSMSGFNSVFLIPVRTENNTFNKDPKGTGIFPDGSPEQDILWLRIQGYSDTEIADHLLRNHLCIDITAEQLGNIVFNEIRSLSGENIQEARENIAHVVINGCKIFGKDRDKYAKTARSVVGETAKKADNQQYNGCQTAALNAVLKHTFGIDPTGNAEHFNLRNEDVTGDFLGAYQTTRIGPFNNSYPSDGLRATGIYVSTYKQRK
jgi:ElaB/YqjD/DUF883 family membrane-anchored ribosome-binding protein